MWLVCQAPMLLSGKRRRDRSTPVSRERLWSVVWPTCLYHDPSRCPCQTRKLSSCSDPCSTTKARTKPLWSRGRGSGTATVRLLERPGESGQVQVSGPQDPCKAARRRRRGYRGKVYGNLSGGSSWAPQSADRVECGVPTDGHLAGGVAVCLAAGLAGRPRSPRWFWPPPLSGC